ncbi:MFS transporter [Thermofilum pendens]|uniref:Major facilitator superfamily MFS_1 n=1 Tax=Thermofilum pendens (strain DSM 2475 / Hrk 5) TaxID=368408 RepID=A1S0Q6_THEPD|nr:MFS transporter [Thermofilum pendens]ABL79036.1 major facilitator superfamily MFS_1 [Thermofilum pendens Hrk 5]
MDTAHKKYLLTALSITTLGAFMAGLDARIVVVGLDVIASALKADIEEALWFTQAYMLGSTLMLLLAGKLADLYGRVKLYAYGFLLFTLGSILSGAAATPLQLAASRFLQGLGAGVLTTLSATIITDVAVGGPLAFALSINSLAFRLGSILGLTASGLIIGLLGWRGIFYVNVPVGIAGAILSRKRLRETYTPREKPLIDWVGFCLFTVSLLGLLLALTFYAYGLSYRSFARLLLLVSAACFLLFIAVEARSDHPILDLSLFRIWGFTGGNIAQFLNAVAFGAVMLLLTLYYEVALRKSAFETGISLLPFELSFLAFGLLSGRLSDRYGYVKFAILGLLVGSLAQLLLGGLTVSTSPALVAAYSALLGAGNGLFLSPNTSAIMSSVPPERRGVASAIRAIVFNVGMTISLNIAVILISTRIPYETVTQLLVGAELMTSDTATSRALLVDAIAYTFRVLALVNLSAALFSFTRLKGGKTGRALPVLAE